MQVTTSAGTLHRGHARNGHGETFCGRKTELQPTQLSEQEAVKSGDACHQCFKWEYAAEAHRSVTA